ncbi:MAG: DUF3285 domain-containing protein [Thainema sp.]
MSQSTPTTDHSTDNSPAETAIADQSPSTSSTASPTSEPPPSYVKLAMRNMVKKGSKSLFHFALTSVGLLAVLVGLAYLTR